MANEQSETPRGDEASHIIDGVATLSVTSPNSAFENQSVSNTSAESASSLVQETKNSATIPPLQSPPSRPMWNTPEGRIAGYKRMIKKNDLPEHRHNLEALLHYYEEGGKVPEGDEEVWAVEGEVSFGIRNYTSFKEMPERWLYKLRYCDSSKQYQIHRVSQPGDYSISDSEGRVILDE